MSYSQALEQQLALLRFMKSDEFRRFETEEFADKWKAGLASDPLTRRQYDVIRASLEMADPYYWSSDLTKLAEQSSESLPDFKLSADLFPTRAGFWWFSTLLENTIEFHGLPTSVRGLMWLVDKNQQGVYLSFTHERPGWFALFPGNLINWHFGLSAADVVSRAIRRLPDLDVPEFRDEPDRLVKAEERAMKSLTYMRVLFAGLLFIRQHILVTSEQSAERSTRKRLAREGFTHEPLVRVVELRRKQSKSEHHGDSEPVEWSHQWIVSGHWRQQWYPSLNANQPIWVMPYVKGPEDKPLKPPRAKVFAVVR